MGAKQKDKPAIGNLLNGNRRRPKASSPPLYNLLKLKASTTFVAAAYVFSAGLKTWEMSTSSSFTAALEAASSAAFTFGVSWEAASKASASRKQSVASAFGSGFFWSAAVGAL